MPAAMSFERARRCRSSRRPLSASAWATPARVSVPARSPAADKGGAERRRPAARARRRAAGPRRSAPSGGRWRWPRRPARSRAPRFLPLIVASGAGDRPWSGGHGRHERPGGVAKRDAGAERRAASAREPMPLPRSTTRRERLAARPGRRLAAGRRRAERAPTAQRACAGCGPGRGKVQVLNRYKAAQPLALHCRALPLHSPAAGQGLKPRLRMSLASPARALMQVCCAFRSDGPPERLRLADDRQSRDNEGLGALAGQGRARARPTPARPISRSSGCAAIPPG